MPAQKTRSPGCIQSKKKNANCRKRKLKRPVWQRVTVRKRGRAALNWLTMNKSTCNGNLLYYSLHKTHSKFLLQAIDRQDNQCRFHVWDDVWAKIWKLVQGMSPYALQTEATAGAEALRSWDPSWGKKGLICPHQEPGRGRNRTGVEAEPVGTLLHNGKEFRVYSKPKKQPLEGFQQE